uniref:Uncharacterized protein n=1 Tax=Anopheles christyi TaxID=43041 RepID=A0A182KJ61_9DIPT
MRRACVSDPYRQNSLGPQHASTTGGLDALLGTAGEVFRLHNDWATRLRESTGSEQLESTYELDQINHRDLLGRLLCLITDLLRHQVPQM